MQAAQRNSRRTHACYVCGGYKELPQHRGQRCSGFLSPNGEFQYCSREEAAGTLTAGDGGLYLHILNRPCHCGKYHDTSCAPPQPLPAALPRATATSSTPPEVTAIYEYVDAAGDHLYHKVRLGEGDEKQFRYQHQAGGVMVAGRGPSSPVLYNLNLIAQHPEETVWVVEGEKDADSLGALNLLGTTAPEGAALSDAAVYPNWRQSYTDALAGRTVVVLADNDLPGERHATAVSRALLGAGCTVRLVRLPDLPPHGDVSDWLASGHSRRDLLEAVIATEPLAPEDAAAPEEGDLGEEDAPAPRARRFRTLSMDELGGLRPATYLIEHLLEAGSAALVYGPPGSAKSFVVLDWALCVAYGCNWFGRATRQGHVLYIAAENAHGYRGRIDAWKKRRRIAHSTDRFKLLPHPINMANPAEIGDLIADLRDESPTWALVVLDTLAQCTGGADEIAPGDMKLAMHQARRITRETGATVLIVHHPDKAGTGPRGSTVIPGDVDTQIAIAKDDDVLIHCEKQRNGQAFDDITLALRQMELEGHDAEEGIIPTSCYLAFPRRQSDILNLSREERALLRTLSMQQGFGMTRRELGQATNLEPRATLSLLEKLSYAGLVGHEGWARNTVRHYWATEHGKRAIGVVGQAPVDDEAHGDAPPPPGTCTLCGSLAVTGGSCADCGTEAS